MTPEHKQQALELINQFDNGGAWRRRAVRRLRRILSNSPETFWQEYFETVNQPIPELAVLVRSGRITEETTIAEGHRIFAEEFSNSAKGDNAK